MKIKQLAAISLAGLMAVSMLTGCGMNKDAIVTRIGDRTVKLGMVNFMARYEQAAMDDLYRTYFGEDIWQQDLYGNGSTMEEETISSVMDTLHGLMTLADEAHMQEYGVSVTDEELAKISETAEAFLQANSKEAIKEMGATKELVSEMLRLFTIKSKMHAAMIEGADTEISDEEANMRGYTVVSVNNASHYDSESGSYVPYTEEEAAKIEADMQAVAEAIKTGSTMEDAAEAYDMTANYKTYAADDTTLDEVVKTALDALHEGEVSDVLTTEGMLYIVRLDAETDEQETANHRESIIAERQSAHFDELLAAWQEDDGWDANTNTKQLEEIHFKNGFTQETEEATENGTEE